MIILVGIPGCGKSSILKDALEQIPSLNIVNYGDKMLEEAERQGLSRDELRKMPIADQQKIGIRAAKKIAKEKPAIVDSHMLIRTPMGFVPGFPREVLDILSPTALAWIECSPSQILRRRMQDSSRKRDDETEEELKTHIELMRTYLTSCSMYSGAILCPIENHFPSIRENTKPLIRLIRTMS